MDNKNLIKDKLNIWNKALFIEGLRQTKWLFIIGAIVCGVLICFSNVATQYYYIVPMDSTLAIIVALLFITAIMFRLFKFVNKRHSGDFYYSIAKKRITIFVTHLSVAMVWTLVIAIVISLTSYFSRLNIQLIGFGEEYYYSSLSSKLMGFGNEYAEKGLRVGLYLLPYALLVMGIFSIAMATTGTGLANVLTMLIILFVPVWLIDYYVTSYYDLIPFIERNNAFDGIFSMVSISYMGICVIGIVGLIIGGILFIRRKAELAGVSTLNRFWQMILRLATTMVVTVEVDALAASWLIHRDISKDSLRMLILLVFVSVIVWLLFDLITERKLRKVITALKQLPVLIIVNVIIVISFTVSGYIYSKTPELANIDSVRIMNYNSDSYEENNLSGLEYIFENVVFTDKEDISIILKQLETDMEKYRSSANYRMGYVDYSEPYSITGLLLDSGVDSSYAGEAMWIEFMIGNEPFIRKINVTNNLKLDVNAMFAKKAEELYDYEFPLVPRTETEVYQPILSDCTAFGWDFSEEELMDLYDCLYHELLHKELPLITFMGRDYHTEGVFDFLCYYDLSGENNKGRIEIPISLDTPESLELLANMGNERRKLTFDFDWFVEYIKDIGDQELGGTLEVILYAGDGDNIRYESFSWWSNYNADMSVENLEKIQSIVNKHEADDKISAEENLLMLVYKNIDGVETTGYWFNLTDDEAATIDSMIWSQGKFERYKYFDYFSY